ncbi:MAG: DUF6497 family protein [Roseobacter sp.]
MRVGPHARRLNFAPSSELRVQQFVPSGQPVELFEVLIDEVGAEAWLRFRFLAPSIGKASGKLTFVEAQDDFEHLCQAVALPYLVEFDLSADVVVIALLDRLVVFGEADPEATQYIEAFHVAEGDCVQEGEW